MDLSRLEPKMFEGLADTSYDLIVTLSPEAHHHATEMTSTMKTEVEFRQTQAPNFISGNRDQFLKRIKQRFLVTHAIYI